MPDPPKPPDTSKPSDPIETSGKSNTTSATVPAFRPAALSYVLPAASAGPSLYRRTFGGASAKVERKLVFLIMSFQGDGTDEVLDTVKEKCAELGLNAKRVDDTVGSEPVVKEILANIEKAELIVCDLTHARPNVYYEIGYAHGVGNWGGNILLVAQEGTTLHFDIGGNRVWFYSSMKGLRAILRKNLPKMHEEVTRLLDSELIVPAAASPRKPAD